MNVALPSPTQGPPGPLSPAQRPASASVEITPAGRQPAESAPHRRRVWVALTIALMTGAYAAARALHEPAWPTDFDQLWHAARALVQGANPYDVVGPGRTFAWDWPLFYPLPAVLFAVPFTLLPVAAARVAFSTLAGGALGWAMGPRIRTHWPLLLSASYLIATSRTQWAPLLLTAAWAPAFGAVLAAKPNVGLAVLASLSRRGLAVALAGCAVAAGVSLVVSPGWFGRWLTAVESAPHIMAPIAMPGGFLLVLAALRWRRADARLLLAMACVPHTPSLYDLLPLFFVCRTLRESLGLALLTQVLFWGIVGFASFPTFDAYAAGLGQVSIAVVYLPALLAVLARPNESADDSSSSPATDGVAWWRPMLPTSAVDRALFLLLVVAATLLVWLPLVTYR